MRIIFLSILSVIYLVTVSAQTPPKPKNVQITSENGSTTSGAVRDGVFRSEKYGLSLEIPDKFTIISTAESAVYREAGLDLLKANDKETKKIEEAENRATSLIAVSAKPFGEPLNSSLEISAASQQPGVTASMVLAANVAMFQGSAYALQRSIPNLKIGVNHYAAADFEVAIGAAKIYQRMYIKMHKGYSIVIVNTHHNNEQREQIEAMLAKIVFTK